jgi:hypothetical protein
MEPSCWQHLFESCTFLQINSAPQDSFGKGLEASFDLLLSLAAIEFCCTIDGGVVFVGYRTLIYPTAIEGDCAQFHVLTCNEDQIDPFTTKYENRHLIEDWKQFRAKRCFLGWCTYAGINLGTDRISASTIRYTGAPEKEKSRQPEGYTGMSQIGISSPFTFMLGLEKNFKYDSHKVHHTPINNYTRLLHDAAKEPAMFYDSGSKRCWLVPKLSLMLHMSQAYAVNNGGLLQNDPPFVHTHADAFELIHHFTPLGDIILMADDDANFLFRHLLHRINLNLLQARRATKASNKKVLYGFEFMDLVTEPDRGSCMKELQLQPAGKTWSALANAVGTIVVCKNAGDVITSISGPAQCRTIPEGHDYLAAPLDLLEILAKRRGDSIFKGPGEINLGHRAMWDITSNPFTPCTHRDNDKASCWEKDEVWQGLNGDSAMEQIEEKFIHLISASGNMERYWEKVSEFLSMKKEALMDTTQLSKYGAVVFGKRAG